MASGDGSKRGLPAGRLPSLRGPRDLTLGGVRKKVFAPNLAAVKSEPKLDVAADVSPVPNAEVGGRGEGRGRSERGRDDRGRGRGRGMNSNIVQMKSIFEEASRDVQPRARNDMPSFSRYRGSGGGGGGGGEGGGDMKNDIHEQENEEEAKARLDRLLMDDFMDLKHLEDGASNMCPIYMTGSGFNNSAKDEKNLLTESKLLNKVKKEPCIDDDSMDSLSRFSGATESLSTKSDESSQDKITQASQLFNKPVKSEHAELMLIQMPDIIPGLPLDKLTGAVDQRGRYQQQPHQQQQQQQQTEIDTDEKKKVETSSLGDFTEGLIGKLQIRRSGRVELKLGDTALDVNLGADVGFLQDLASIRIDHREAGDMCVLGHIQHKIVCVPNLEDLLYSTSNRR